MKKQNITLSLALAAVFSSSVAFAETEVTGKIVHESSAFTERGEVIGSKDNQYVAGDIHHGKGAMMKSETSAKIYIDGDIEEVGEGSTFHVELNGFNDSEAIDTFGDNQSYTQRDALREAYVDTEYEGVSLRIGKQQVVWGTADGMKLLDAINPTDYTEMAQNQMEDSRIPLWMVNAETEDVDGGNWQFVVSEAKANKFAGLGVASAKGTEHTNNAKGHAFVMKGVDSITGKVQGFLSAAPQLGRVAYLKFGGNFTGGTQAGAELGSSNYRGYNQTVHDYVNNNSLIFNAAGATTTSWQKLCEDNSQVVDNGRNLCETSDASFTNPNNMFEFMPVTSFTTFDTMGSMTTEYRVDKSDGANINLRYKNSTKDGINYSVNYMKAKDVNPHVDLHWESNTGTRLYVGTTSNKQNTNGDDSSTSEADTVTSAGSAVTTVHLFTSKTSADSTTDVYTTVANTYTGGASNPANLVFTEKYNDIQNLGGSFDMAVETTDFGPVVLRGEALYQRDVMSPILDRKKLGYGDLAGALTMKEGDYFKYVVGADITVMTNMMLSAQFIQERNLDFVDENQSCSAQASICTKYTADRAVMSMTNGLQKAEKNKEFYSLFLSKPFGASGEHRWNNIFMFEENGGKWNRLDAEFSIDDDTQATVEFNKYFGDENTQFGQLSKSSNIQVGVKYSF